MTWRARGFKTRNRGEWQGLGVGSCAEGGDKARSCAVAPGFYEGTTAFVNPLDFVMSPTGRGAFSEAPLHPRAPGGAAPLVPPCFPARRPFGGSFPPARGAFGRSAAGDANARKAPAATTARGCLYPCPRCDACAAAKARRHTLLRTSRCRLNWRSLQAADQAPWSVHINQAPARISSWSHTDYFKSFVPRPTRVRKRSTTYLVHRHNVPCRPRLREIRAHRIPVARSPGGASRRREAGGERNAVQEEWR